MATVTAVTIQRSGPAVREALARHAPHDISRFEREMQDALRQAHESLDLSMADEVLRRWHALATLAANSLTAAESAQVARARTGDLTGLRERLDDGTWVTEH